MGGKNETNVGEYRMHVSNNEVHVHDDKCSKKYSENLSSFKEDLKEGMSCLKSNKDGIIKIGGGKGSDLYLMKDNGKYHLFISSPISIKDLSKFLKNI